MGSDESHFNVSLIVRHKVTRQCAQTTTFEEKGEPTRNQTDVPVAYIAFISGTLGDTGTIHNLFLQT